MQFVWIQCTSKLFLIKALVKHDLLNMDKNQLLQCMLKIDYGKIMFELKIMFEVYLDAKYLVNFRL